MMTACMPLSRKYSPMVHPANGARNCMGAGSEAVAATMMEYSSAPCSSSTFTNCATVDQALLRLRGCGAEALDSRAVREGAGGARCARIFHHRGGDGFRSGAHAVPGAVCRVHHGRVFPRQRHACRHRL